MSINLAITVSLLMQHDGRLNRPAKCVLNRLVWVLGKPALRDNTIEQ